ncbi:hypothetical protein JB92DRAFT_3049539 [Gautieria morchelliformis]|nr:hypothetical protein JB92DRAFT_3049539 [Gautieria morchelliformis]
MAPTGTPSLRLYGLPVSRSSHPSPATPAILTPPPISPGGPSDNTSTAERSFTDPTLPMPPPGPALFVARRALWLAPPADTPREPHPASASTSRAKLEVLLSQEGRADDDVVWDAGLRSVWKGLISGGRLRRRLPLRMVIKILKAGWLRDGTWPSDSATGPPSPVPADLPVAVPPRHETARGDDRDK